jgi:hypothetical protein
MWSLFDRTIYIQQIQSRLEENPIEDDIGLG